MASWVMSAGAPGGEKHRTSRCAAGAIKKRRATLRVVHCGVRVSGVLYELLPHPRLRLDSHRLRAADDRVLDLAAREAHTDRHR